MSDFAKKLRALRKARGLSQTELARGCIMAIQPSAIMSADEMNPAWMT